MSSAVDIFMVYQFVRRLATPFDEWDAFEQDIIDADGNVLKSRKDLRSREEKNAFGVFDVMILNIKKILEKIPGGKSRIASYAAALYLLREWNHFSKDSLLVESMDDQHIEETVSYFFADKSDYTILENYVNRKVQGDENIFEDGAPTNSAGGGGVAGIGVGDDGEPGFTPAMVKRHKRKNKMLQRYKDLARERNASK